MNQLFRSYIDKFVIIYLDDVLIYSRNKEEHAEHLRLVLTVLRDNQLWGKLGKCDFYKSTIKFVGHVISKDGISVHPDKIKALIDWPTPQTVQHVRQFLGLATYYRRFVKDFSSKAVPLTDLTRGNQKSTKIEWSDILNQAFKTLKEELTKTPVLTTGSKLDVYRPNRRLRHHHRRSADAGQRQWPSTNSLRIPKAEIGRTELPCSRKRNVSLSTRTTIMALLPPRTKVRRENKTTAR